MNTVLGKVSGRKSNGKVRGDAALGDLASTHVPYRTIPYRSRDLAQNWDTSFVRLDVRPSLSTFRGDAALPHQAFSAQICLAIKSASIHPMSGSGPAFHDAGKVPTLSTDHIYLPTIMLEVLVFSIIHQHHDTSSDSTLCQLSLLIYTIMLFSTLAQVSSVFGLLDTRSSQKPLSSGTSLLHASQIPGRTPLRLCPESRDSDLFQISSAIIDRQPVYM